MNKVKPNIFVNQIDKKINNSQQIYYSKNSEQLSKKIMKNSELLNKFKNMSVSQKISNLMSLPKYLYNIDLDIMTNNGTIRTKIVGKNNANLMTTDNKLIPIADVTDINIIK